VADLIVSFGRAVGQVMSGDDVRTEKVTIGSSSTAATLTAGGRDNVVRLHALAACWVRVGASPEADDPATPGGTSFYMASGDREWAGIEQGMTVAVVEAADGSA
jgi:hypothetical protein